eukprot:963915_1
MCRKRLNATQEAGVEEKEIHQDLALDSSKLRNDVLKGCLIGLPIGLLWTCILFAVSGTFDDNLVNMPRMREITIYGFEHGDIVRISRDKPVNRYEYVHDMIATVLYGRSVTFSSKGNPVIFDAIYDSFPVDLWVVYSQPGDDTPRQMQKWKYSGPEAGRSLNNLGEAGVREDIDCTKCSAVVYAGSHVEVLNLEKAQGESVSVKQRRQPG